MNALRVVDLIPDASPVVAELLLTLSVDESCGLAAWPRNRGYAMIRAGEWPSPILRQGKRIIVVTLPFLRVLGLLAVEENEAP